MKNIKNLFQFKYHLNIIIKLVHISLLIHYHSELDQLSNKAGSSELLHDNLYFI